MMVKNLVDRKVKELMFLHIIFIKGSDFEK